jgi:hypothetical protein
MMQLEQAEADLQADKPTLPPPPPPRAEASEAQIDLGLLGPELGEGSGISVVQWSSLVDAKPTSVEPSGDSDEVSIDAPSDADLRGEFPAPKTMKGPPQHQAPPTQVLSSSGQEPDEGTEPLLDLNALEGPGEEPAPPPEKGGEVPVLDLEALAREREKQQKPAAGEKDKGFDLSDLIEAARAPAPASQEDDDMIDLYAVEPVPPSSGIDYGGEELVQEGAGSEPFDPDEIVVEHEVRPDRDSEIVELGGDLVMVEDASPSSSVDPSAVNLNMEASEDSGVLDLGEDAVMVDEPAPPGGGESGVIDVGIDDVEEVIEEEVSNESGVIDLGDDLVVVEEASASGRGGSGILDFDEVEVVEEEPGSDVELGQEPRSHDSTTSGRDLIAEAVESGLGMQAPNLDLGEKRGKSKDLPLEKIAGHEEPSAVDLAPSGKQEKPPTSPSATGVTAESEEADLEFLNSVIQSSASGSRSGTGQEAVDLPLEEIEMESDAIDLAGAPGKLDDSAGSGIHSEEEVDLAALMGEEGGDSKAGEPRSGGPHQSEEHIDLDAETVDLASGESSSLALQRAAMEEEGSDLDVLRAAPSSGLRIDDLASEEEEALEDEAEAEEMAVPQEGEEGAEFEEAPARPSQTRAWVGGGVAGALAGAGLCLGLVYFGLIPGLGGTSDKSSSRPPVNPVTNQQQPVTPALTAADYMKIGDLDNAKKAGIEKMGDKPADLALRGQYRWEDYLVKQARANAALNSEAPEVKQALDDLQKSNTPDSLFQLGQIQEMTNKWKEAEATYRQGANQFKNDRRFQAGLLRLEALQEAQPAGNLPRPVGETSLRPAAPEAALLALLLVGLQQPNQAVPAGESEEAGLYFWQAIKLAREQKYQEALKTLDDARKLHDQRRRLFPRKPQNPATDPNEQIFLQACNELETYWKMRQQLNGGGYLKDLADRGAPNQAVTALIKEVTELRVAKADLGKQLDTAKKDLTDANNLKTDLGKQLDTTKKELADANNLKTDLSKQLDTTKKDLADANNLKTDLSKQLMTSQKQAADQDALLKQVQTDLFKSSYVKAVNDRAQLVPGLQAALKVATMKDPQGALGKLAKENGDLQAELTKEKAASKETLAKETTRLTDERNKAVSAIKDQMDKKVASVEAERVKETTSLREQLKLRRSPAEMLAIWLPIVENSDREQSLRAVADAGSVLDDPMAAPAIKAQAKVIQGLGFRNLDKFPEARMVLTEALKALPADAKDWRNAAKMGLEDVSNPLAYFTSRSEEASNRGDLQQARSALDRGIRVLGENNAGLLAERSLLLLEQARSRSVEGNPPVGDPNLNQSLKDAEEAIKKTEGKDDQKAARAQAFYARGRFYEDLGEPADALENYQTAVREYPAADAAGLRYRLAQARLLARPRQGRPPLPPPAPKEEPKKKEDGKVGQLPTLDQVRQLAANPQTQNEARAALAVLLTVALHQPEVFQPGKAQAMKIADEIIQQYELDPRSVPFDVVAGAYMIKGQYTRALLIYAEGLKPHLRPDYYEGLMNILQNHPQVRRPPSLNPPNPFEAESEYARGLRFYFACDYGRAEKHFRAATEYDNQDARYFYFLGLSKLMQGNADASEDFEQGARLEKQNKPASPTVSISLERVQGPARKVLNEARYGVR